MTQDTEDKILNYCTYAAAAVILFLLLFLFWVITKDRSEHSQELPQTVQLQDEKPVIHGHETM